MTAEYSTAEKKKYICMSGLTRCTHSPCPKGKQQPIKHHPKQLDYRSFLNDYCLCRAVAGKDTATSTKEASRYKSSNLEEALPRKATT